MTLPSLGMVPPRFQGRGLPGAFSPRWAISQRFPHGFLAFFFNLKGGIPESYGGSPSHPFVDGIFNGIFRYPSSFNGVCTHLMENPSDVKTAPARWFSTCWMKVTARGAQCRPVDGVCCRTFPCLKGFQKRGSIRLQDVKMSGTRAAFEVALPSMNSLKVSRRWKDQPPVEIH